ncbi:hypothetical protein [Streptomyces sp. NPDC002044]|uniref:hypothetical protein n=1 Tax=Streptomyces sp. NPDC002044 TaxID=3154662 RepID=UPI00332146E8
MSSASEPELPAPVPENRDAVTPDLPPVGSGAPDLPGAGPDGPRPDDAEGKRTDKATDKATDEATDEAAENDTAAGSGSEGAGAQEPPD